MASRSRIVFPGCPHHVIVRGERRRRLFLDAGDVDCFVDQVRRASAEAPVWAWAVMSNHVHLILVPDRAASIGNAMNACMQAYERAFESRYGPGGPLWQSRVYASVLDRQEFLWKAVRYVERNPVEAGIVRRAEDYRWSSAAYHCGLRETDPLVADDSPLRGAIGDWSGWLGAREPHPVKRTGTSSRFVSRLEYLNGRKRLGPAKGDRK
jgi:putative transposase